MNEKNGDEIKSDEQKQKPTCESGTGVTADDIDDAEFEAVLTKSLAYGVALDEIRLLFDEDSRLEDPVQSLCRIVVALEKMDIILKSVGK